VYQPSTIARPRLERRLDGALARRLTCVIAGPGFGKTTLLTRWAASTTSAWHGMDELAVEAAPFPPGV
jgi:LuxR family transcriptional regulator, maltose regulon positive regulatory protein